MRRPLDISPASVAEFWQGLRLGLLVGIAALVLVLPPGERNEQIAQAAQAARPPAATIAAAALPAAPSPPPIERALDFGHERPSAEARRLAAWVVNAADNGRQPFAIIDKTGARVYLFRPSGRLIGAAPVLLGFARGDDNAPGIGQKTLAQIRPGERTTPAGRHVAKPGRNALGHDVLWVDYDAAVSMHRVRSTDPRERRVARLASPSARDNRISYGCINLPSAFFDQHFWPHFGNTQSIVYILPESKPLLTVFPSLATSTTVRDETPRSPGGHRRAGVRLRHLAVSIPAVRTPGLTAGTVRISEWAGCLDWGVLGRAAWWPVPSRGARAVACSLPDRQGRRCRRSRRRALRLR
ncbi:MAG: hypothetical protein IT499_20235 [Rubrivivax sp.]|jgi:hypothetical protein|nr:hypothetical protein [Rubrivivax sp.]